MQMNFLTNPILFFFFLRITLRDILVDDGLAKKEVTRVCFLFDSFVIITI